MARLLLIRHATTAITGKRLTGRLPGFPLDQRGRKQAEGLSERLADVPLTAIYASPIERAWETALALAANHRGKPIPHEGLVDTDYGQWAGRTLNSVRPLKAWKKGLAHPSRMRFPGGESLLEVQRRAVEVCEEVSARHRRGTVALVTHADPIRMSVSYFLGQPLDLFERLGCAPASVTVLDLPPDGAARLLAVNTNGDPSTWQ